MRTEPDLPALRATRRALTLAQGLFPVTVPRDAPDDYRIGAGLTARCATTAEAAAHLAELGRRTDLMVCARTLFEHVVTLAWLFGSDDVEHRFLLWQRYCDEQALRMDNDIARLSGEPPRLSEQARATIAKSTAKLGNTRIPNLADRTMVADREWATELGFDPGAENPWSLRRLYSIVYRVGSTLAHPTIAGLVFVTDRSERGHQITLEPTGRAADSMLPVPFLLGIALGVTSVRFGVPKRDELNAYIDSLIESMRNDPNWVAVPPT